MEIAVIGTGSVGAVLGRRWAGAGHRVVFGSRRPDDPEIVELVQSAGSSASAAPPEAAAAGAQVVVLAVPGDRAAEIASSLGDLTGKVVVDCTNPILPGLSGLSVAGDDSGAEVLQRALPGIPVVKTLNTTGAGNMDDPVYPRGPLAMFVCGDDEAARATVAGLVEELGFQAVDCGPLRTSRYLEPLAMLWITLASRGLGRDFGFLLTTRDEG